MNLNNRYFKSYKHFVGTAEQKQREADGSNVINHAYELDITATRTINLRWSLAAIPDHLNQVEGYLTPADRVVTAAELQDRSKAELRVMRNEVYAHHGKVFQDAELHSYFSKKSWYRQNPAYSDGLLTDVDKENARVIQEFENKAQ
jgi:hypothetical protein